MSVGSLFFSVCALVALVGAVSTVAAKNPIRGAVGLLATIVAIAALFLKLAAQFLAAIQLIVYAGAVVVLFVFVIMLLGPDANTGEKSAKVRLSRWGGAVLLTVITGVALFVTRKGFGPLVALGPVRADFGSTEAVGGLVFRNGLVPFEIATALLIVAVVGAIAVARSKPHAKKPRPAGHETRRLFAGPLHPRDAERPLPKESAR
ncbi:MAG: NADH-quinone oxidoreductase subunit J [Myxococcales bacterium]|nr:NADH-quinone oxidoreductase subunit J [Myxococcales bacterium]